MCCPLVGAKVCLLCDGCGALCVVASCSLFVIVIGLLFLLQAACWLLFVAWCVLVVVVCLLSAVYNLLVVDGWLL